MSLDSATMDVLRPWLPALPLEAVRVVQSGPVCWLVGNVLRQGALAFSPYVFYGRSRFDPADQSTLPLLAHELRHLEQYRRYGHLGFLGRYFRDLAGNRFRYDRQLPLEAEAYDLQERVAQALSGP